MLPPGPRARCAPQKPPIRHPLIIASVCGQLTAPWLMNHAEAATVLRLDTRFLATLARR